jgi:hypothetical protein
MLLIPAVLLMASCGGRDVVYVQVPESAPSTTNAPITSLPKVTNAPSEEIDFLGLSNVEFLANAWLALRSGDGGDYCYTDCSYINLPDVWIERAGGGLIDNEEVWNWIMFITSKPVSEISEYCDMFYATADADIGAIALESGVDPKAMIVGGYVICDS